MKKFMFPLALVVLMLTSVATWAIAGPPVRESFVNACGDGTTVTFVPAVHAATDLRVYFTNTTPWPVTFTAGILTNTIYPNHPWQPLPVWAIGCPLSFDDGTGNQVNMWIPANAHVTFYSPDNQTIAAWY